MTPKFMSRITVAALSGWVAFSGGCMSMTPESKAVEHIAATSNAGRVEGCKFVGDVSAGTGVGGLFTGVAYDMALVDLKTRAMELGGDIVLFSNVVNNKGATRMSGEAYQCNRTSK